MADISIPNGALINGSSSGNVANSIATATIAAPPNGTNYITAFGLTGAGATASTVVVATLTGVVGGPFSYVICVPAGAQLPVQGIFREFPIPIAGLPGSAVTFSCPALGAGNTNCAVNLQGFRL